MLLAAQDGDLIIEIALLLIQFITRIGRSYDSWTSIIIVLVICIGLGALIIWRRERLNTAATNTNPARNELESSEPQSIEASQDLNLGNSSTPQSAERETSLNSLLTPSLKTALEAVGHTRAGELSVDYLKGEKFPDRASLRQLVQMGYLERGSWIETLFGAPRWIITEAGRQACGVPSPKPMHLASLSGTSLPTGEPAPTLQSLPKTPQYGWFIFGGAPVPSARGSTAPKGVAAIIFLLLVIPASVLIGIYQRNADNCNQLSNPDLAIEGCSRLLDYAILLSLKDVPIAYNNRGNAFLDKGDLDRAITDYDQAITLDPKFARAYSNRGLVFGRKGEFDRAISDYTQAITLDPKNAIAYNNRGLVFGRKGELDRAITDLTEAITLDPKYANAYNNRGEIFGEKGSLRHAISDYTQAIALNPKFARAYLKRSVAFSQKGDLDRARTDYDQAVSLDPTLARLASRP